MNFNKVLNKILEASEDDFEKDDRIDDLVDEISKATASNNHTEARIILADFIGNEDLVSKYKILDAAHKAKGHLTADLRAKRDALDAKLFKDVEENFDKKEFARIMRAY